MDIIFGPYHKGGNHWTLIYVDVVNGTLLYIDPMRPRNENDTAQEFAHKWLEWALLHNSVCPDSAVPSKLTAVTTKHAVQRDGRNCGIFTMCVSVHGSVCKLDIATPNVPKHVHRIFLNLLSVCQTTSGRDICCCRSRSRI